MAVDMDRLNGRRYRNAGSLGHVGELRDDGRQELRIGGRQEPGAHHRADQSRGESLVTIDSPTGDRQSSAVVCSK